MSELTDFSETDGSNTTVTGTSIAEGMAMSGLNNGLRNLIGALIRSYNRLTGKYASTGSANAYVVTPSVALPAYVTGERYSWRSNFANTGATTVNFSSLGAKTIKKYIAAAKADLTANDILSGQPVTVEYDGTDMIVVSPLASMSESVINVYVAIEEITPYSTSGCAAVATNEHGSPPGNTVTKYLAFDAAAQENAFFAVRIPKRWNIGTVDVSLLWAASAAGAGNVLWGVQAAAVSAGDALGVAFAGGVEAASAANGQHVLVVNANSSLTVEGTPAKSDRVFFRVYRQAASGSDTYAADAWLLGAIITYTANAGDDT